MLRRLRSFCRRPIARSITPRIGVCLPATLLVILLGDRPVQAGVGKQPEPLPPGRPYVPSPPPRLRTDLLAMWAYLKRVPPIPRTDSKMQVAWRAMTDNNELNTYLFSPD